MKEVNVKQDTVDEHEDDDAAIDLDDDDEEEEIEEAAPEAAAEGPAAQQPHDKKQQMRERLRKLKMKMNQARQLNRQEVMREGERSHDDGSKERKRQAMLDKKKRQAEWEARNGKAMQVADEANVDGKYLVEQAADSVRTAMKKADKAEKARYGMKDYYNPEGQYRNYERNLKSLPSSSAAAASSDSTYNPLNQNSSSSGDKDERRGAHVLALELKRRSEKASKKRRSRMEFEGTDVTSINERNKRFNQKISRNFDKDTAEIRQNLERGTAL